ncbi:GIY-YIG nuclease family protein [Mycoplasma sp. AC157]|uniref:GIY-YIG nuclease family protein n=1 Tax=Mycoplasma sp. 480 TaxID=3440155 RepID=UPI003F512D4B
MLTKVKKVTTKPGVYFWKNEKNEIIYIGKAKNLRNRMMQYFKGSINSRYTYKMVEEIRDFEIIETNSEKDSLILETRLINEKKPKYNILLKNNKKYPYLVVKKDKKISILRENNFKEGKNLYHFGPLPPSYGFREIQNLIEKMFLYKDGLKIKEDQWNEESLNSTFFQIKKLLSNKMSFFIKELKEKYEIYKFDDVKLELALEIKKFIDKLEKNLNEKQTIELNIEYDVDIFDIQETEKFFFTTIFIYRAGSLLSIIDDKFDKNTDKNLFIANFINEYYKENIIPKKIVLGANFSNIDFNLINLDKKIQIAKKGQFKLACENAESHNKNRISKIDEIKNQNQDFIILELKEKLQLQKLENFIIIDNSFELDKVPVTSILYYNKTENIEDLNFFYVHKNSKSNSDVDFMKQGFQKYLEKFSHLELDLILVDGFQNQISAIDKILFKNSLSIQVFGLKKDEHHRTKYLVDYKDNQINVSEHLFLFLSKIQEKVDKTAKNYRNAIKLKKFN